MRKPVKVTERHAVAALIKAFDRNLMATRTKEFAASDRLGQFNLVNLKNFLTALESLGIDTTPIRQAGTDDNLLTQALLNTLNGYLFAPAGTSPTGQPDPASVFTTTKATRGAGRYDVFKDLQARPLGNSNPANMTPRGGK